MAATSGNKSSGIGGVLFLLFIIVIVIAIIAMKVMYNLYATSMTLNLMKNNSGSFSSSRILIWVGAIIAITILMVMLQKKQRKYTK
jgi:hypothetical protein